MLARRKPWTRPEPLVAKPQTRSAIDKGPARSSDWLARIRSLPCLVCAPGEQQNRTEAHHCKGLFPRTVGKRVSDLLCLPLCSPGHHRLSTVALHNTLDELGWWRSKGIEPYGVLLSMLAQCRDPSRDEAIAFVKLHRERAAA